jgi:hypothetical protein
MYNGGELFSRRVMKPFRMRPANPNNLGVGNMSANNAVLRP